MNWNEEATNIIKAYKVRKGKNWDEIADLLRVRLGVKVAGKTLANRVNDGAFSFALALQILSVLDVEKLEVPRVE